MHKAEAGFFFEIAKGFGVFFESEKRKFGFVAFFSCLWGFFPVVEKCKTSFLSTIQLQKPEDAAAPADLTGALCRSSRTREHFLTFTKVLLGLASPGSGCLYASHIFFQIFTSLGTGGVTILGNVQKNMDVAPGHGLVDQGGAAGLMAGFDDPEGLSQAGFCVPVTGGQDSVSAPAVPGGAGSAGCAHKHQRCFDKDIFK